MSTSTFTKISAAAVIAVAVALALPDVFGADQKGKNEKNGQNNQKDDGQQNQNDDGGKKPLKNAELRAGNAAPAVNAALGAVAGIPAAMLKREGILQAEIVKGKNGKNEKNGQNNQNDDGQQNQKDDGQKNQKGKNQKQ